MSGNLPSGSGWRVGLSHDLVIDNRHEWHRDGVEGGLQYLAAWRTSVSTNATNWRTILHVDTEMTTALMDWAHCSIRTNDNLGCHKQALRLAVWLGLWLESDIWQE